VIADLEKSDRAPTWFTADGVQPGEWVHFEAPMSYAAVGDGVFFLDLDQSTTYPTGGAVRLMPHGSLEHLTGTAPRASTRELAHDLGMSASTIRRLFDSLEQHLADSDEQVGKDRERRRAPGFQRARFLLVVEKLGEQLELEYTAAWMAGYARVTAVFAFGAERRIVLATPLYVEYVSQPSPVD
jgi:hypothetical protein